MQLQKRVALVTGGGSGIGQAIAQHFAAAGARVVVADLDQQRAETTVRLIEEAGGAALAVAADVADATAVAKMGARAEEVYGAVDILVNNAAIAEGDDILTLAEETWERNLAVVLKSVFLCSKILLPGMIARRHGAIVNISSVNGLTGLGEEAYSAAKAGVINLTRNMAVKYGRYGVRANVICPGTVQTPIWEAVRQKDPAVFDKLARWYPLGRVGLPEDVAKAALFLASDDAAWITGATLVVDGGLMAGNSRMGQDLLGAGE
jgi:NAD(P)-dependent dehydrogenase (short-subunit alcohol dehydrogenase family)